jgi:hypothetical protein
MAGIEAAIFTHFTETISWFPTAVVTICYPLFISMPRGCETGITGRTGGAQSLTVSLRQVFKRYRVVLWRVQLDGSFGLKSSRHFSSIFLSQKTMRCEAKELRKREELLSRSAFSACCSPTSAQRMGTGRTDHMPKIRSHAVMGKDFQP